MYKKNVIMICYMTIISENHYVGNEIFQEILSSNKMLKYVVLCSYVNIDTEAVHD